MMRALFAAISGLRNHQLFMDTVGNNLANVNTTGFKASRMTFSDLLSQTLSSGSAPTATLGGINSKQIGLGMQIASIDVLQLQGSMQTTGKVTDLAIQGDGFFILNNGSKDSYTRDGAFEIASDGTLVNPSTGMKVQGWSIFTAGGAEDLTMTNADGTVNTSGAIRDLVIPIGQSTVAKATSKTALAGNLDSRATDTPAPADTAQVGLTVVDSLGKPHTITLTFTKTANAGEWTYDATPSAAALLADPEVTGASLTGTLQFGANGQITDSGASTAAPFLENLTVTLTGTNATIGTAGVIEVDFGKLTGFASTSEVAMSEQNGSTAGTLVAFRLGAKGEVVGIYSNGQAKNLGQLALANFTNAGGLTRSGGNLFDESASSGNAIVGIPGGGGRGVATAGNLESSNVDLSREFTNMIIGQRGFQANARVISTSDEMLADLVHLRG